MTEAAEKSNVMPIPEGETPREAPDPIVPFAGLDELYAGNRSVGFFREIQPCPSSGRISFKQIGDLREYDGVPVEMDDDRLLNCRKPAPAGDGAYYQPAATNDPSDYYNAVWGSEGVVNRGRELPMNPIGTWNENFPPPYPLDSWWEEGSFQYRGVTAKDQGFRIYCTSEARYEWTGEIGPGGGGIYKWRYYKKATNAVGYIGRFDAGTRLSMALETTSYSSVRGGWSVRGWTQGFFQGDQKIYNEGSVSRGANTQTVDIEVDDAHKDIWIAFQQDSDDDSDTQQSFELNNFWIWRT
jgi:hypothetical protein